MPLLIEQVEKRLKDLDFTRYTKLQDYYEGESDIIDRTFNDTTKPNNKIVNNYAGYIVDIILGYFMGKAINYTCEDESYMEALQEVLDDNEERTQNSLLAKQIGIKGKVYELVYLDENADIKFAKINAENIFPVYDNGIKPKLIGAVRLWTLGEEYFWEMYDEQFIKSGKIEKDIMTVMYEQEHFFGELPLIEYSNNEEQLGDFEKVITLIDAYDKSRSDTANDFEYFTDAYLKLSGCQVDVVADADGIATMRKNRLISLPEGGNAEFLIKSINDTALENNNNRIKQDIHKFSFTPDLTDDAFGGTVSGIALQFKLFGLEQIAQTKENFFRQGLKKRLRLITTILNTKGANYNYKDVVMAFNRNMPINVLETVQTMTLLRGLISDETIISNLPMIDDPAYEIEKRLKEQELQPRVDLGSVPDKTVEDEQEDVEEIEQENIPMTE